MQLLCLYGPRKSIAKNELSKQQLTVTLSDCNHLAHVIVLWQIHKFMCHCAVFALYYFQFEDNFQVSASGGLYLEGQFNSGFFALRVWGVYIWKG